MLRPMPQDTLLSPQRFIADILRNRHNRAILEAWAALELPDGWLVAGCLFQTVWNLRVQRAPEDGIKDYNIFYFDADDLSEEAEARMQARVDRALGSLGVPIEVKNQARVHLWYEAHFGYPYPKLANAQEGIDRFLIPSTCVGVRPKDGGARALLPQRAAGALCGAIDAQSADPPSPPVPGQGRLVQEPVGLAGGGGLGVILSGRSDLA